MLAEQRRQSLRDTLVRIADLAVTEQVDALMCGGDLYEHDRFTPTLSPSFARSLLGSILGRYSSRRGTTIGWSRESVCAGRLEPQRSRVQEDRSPPVTLTDGVTLWGAAHRAPANTNGFLDNFAVDRGGVHLALFHGSEQGALGFQEQGKVPHAPFRLEQIPRRDCTTRCSAISTVHGEPSIRHTPGNPDPLTFGEDGVRGAVLIEVQPNGSVTQDWREVAPRAMRDLKIDVSGCASQQDVRDRLNAAVAGFDGFVRVTLTGDLDPDVDLAPLALELKQSSTPCVVLRTVGLKVAYDLDLIKLESTVRGQFVRDVLIRTELDDDLRQHVIITGLRALDGRADLNALP